MPRRLLDLNGSHWRVGQAPESSSPQHAQWQELDKVREWLPATAPGSIRADLIRAGRLPELISGPQIRASHWVDNYSWWLVCDWRLSPAPDERSMLILRGVDYVSDVFLNGHHLGRHEGMFSPQQHEISRLLQPENRLAVRITGSRWLPYGRSTIWEKLLNRVEARLSGLGASYPDRRDTLKCQMGFGWDFAPPLLTMGIWDDVLVVTSGETLIQDVHTSQRWSDGRVTLEVQIDLDARQTGEFVLSCSLDGETFKSEPSTAAQHVELGAGMNRCSLECSIPEPRKWWPWDHGRPDLYLMTVEVRDGDRIVDSTSQRIGLRRLAWRDWTLHINGQPIYARGANWVPADIVPGQVRASDYDDLLSMARQANMNMLRVWGGGLREKRSFYEQCDRLGLLVWQEFPFACASFARFPRSVEYLHLVESEAAAIVRDLREHPSLVVWCGGNEFNPDRNLPLVSALRRIVTSEDPDRPFLPASPGGGDLHSWQVWHDGWPPSAYLDDEARFASEFGLQAPPDTETLRRFIDPADLWPPGPTWQCHGAGLAGLWRYARPFLADQPDLEAFVDASQKAQAYGLQIAIEHFRRRKAQGCGGALVWQFNEPWPAISWSLVDFFRGPKPAYEMVRRVFRPVLVSIEYSPRRFHAGERFCGRVWIINDLADALPGCHLDVTLWTHSGQPAGQLERTVDVSGASATIADSVDWALPEGGGWRLTCRLTRFDKCLSHNLYDLTAYDDGRPSFWQKVRAYFRDHLLEA